MQSASSSHRHTADRSERIRTLIVEFAQRQSEGALVDESDLLAKHSDLMPELEIELHKLQSIGDALDLADADQAVDVMRQLEADWANDPVSSSGTTDRRSSNRVGPGETDPPGGGSSPKTISVPSEIGRYRVLKALGEGGFGQVFVARDEELQRDVAIKIPHRHRVTDGETAKEYLDEARIVAALDHPAIVPVYDAGRTVQGDSSNVFDVFVVSKLIEGEDLSQRIRRRAFATQDAVRIVIAIAGALHYAHLRGLVHRDIKPANILLDAQERPYLADFGLALQEIDPRQRLSFAGTPNYMSPEQARGEAHRVDCRSDIFSLGVVLYESLTGKKPFYSDSYNELLEQIRWSDPPPLRHWDDSIPPELDRICMKALSKRSADRYQNAKTLVDDLQHLFPNVALVERKTTLQTKARIVPKGLRPFDASDAEVYLGLLPGPRDRNGIPESIRCWKDSIEATGPNDSFAIGLLYGPSGSGKSSLVRAGLLPRLSARVHTVYVEASSDDTSRRLLRSIAHQFSVFEDATDLVQCLADVRRGKGPAQGEKLLIVLDQFEQWLQGKTQKERRALLAALRQCDGERLSCLLSVRDDFWLAVSRFTAELEVDLVQGHNTSLVDLFDVRHAQRVLAEFGRSYECLPDDLKLVDAAQESFLRRAISGLAQEDRVVPVRLALFAEMVKEKPWTTATLRDVGGASGVGVAFLEETFSAAKANPQNRLHEQAVRAVLGALLPEAGSNVRGRILSYGELLDISGYGLKPRLFKELMRILDSETRLLTPMDPKAVDLQAEFVPIGGRYYQLAHDYLVPSLREWLRTKQQSTRVGRTELRLAERSLLWNARPERRQLPSVREWFAIRLLTRSVHWTVAQKEMMRSATRHHAFSTAVIMVLLLTFLLGGVEISAFARNLFMEFRARFAVVWMAVGMEDTVWRLLKQNPDPALRTNVIHGLHPLVASPAEIILELQNQNDVSVRRAMILAAGEIGEPESLRERRSALSESDPLILALLQLYRNDPDPGVHSATKWTLAEYNLERELAQIDRQLRSPELSGERKWYINGQGVTMAVIPGPTEFLMGTEGSNVFAHDDETFHMQAIRRRFCIATEETTVEQFYDFLRANPRIAVHYSGSGSVTSQRPQANLTWYDAAAYCNWINRKEGLPRDQWCYEPNSDGEFQEGMTLVADFLDRRGYRLPTEAEWEYACRAGTTTSRHFGDDISYLANYAVSHAVSPQGPLEVGAGKPNDFGLFDVYGNVAEWCHNRYAPYDEDNSGSASALARKMERVSGAVPRVLRGGSFLDADAFLRSAARQKSNPGRRQGSFGFRIARSYP